jgi:hypothetical protein
MKTFDYSESGDSPDQKTVSSGNYRENSRATVAVVTGDIYKSYARKCIRLVKTHTHDFDLMILDNNGRMDFNHPKEMNRMLDTVKTRFLVLMDDDVFVEEGWLGGLVRCMDDETGIVTPMHRDGRGRLSYTGLHLKGDLCGTHEHTIDLFDAPRATQTICSALVLIDTAKCGQIRFDTSYRKYFLDLDYGLKIWEAGYKVLCSPYTVVTHLGGATALQTMGQQANRLFREDAETFVGEWVRNGRLKNLANSIWTNDKYMKWLIETPGVVDSFFEQDGWCKLKDFKNGVESLLDPVRQYGLFKELIASHLRRASELAASRGDTERRKYCERVIGRLRMVSFSRRMKLRLGRTMAGAISKNPWRRKASASIMGGLDSAFRRYHRFPRFIRKLTDRPVLTVKRTCERFWEIATSDSGSLGNH